MECDFSRAKNPGECKGIELRTVYAIRADHSYDALRTDTDRHGYVALRTVGGAGLLHISGIDPLRADAGSIIFFEQRQIDRYYCAENSWDFWWFEFECGESLDFPLNRLFYLERSELEIQESKVALDMLKIDSGISNRLASAAMTALYYRWLIQYRNIALPVSPYQADIQKVIMRMKTSCRKPLRLGEMAEMTGICERRFRQIFKSVAGMAPKKYYDVVRVEMAENLLRTTSLTVAEIADQLGFSSPYHFSRSFTQICGLPPTGYRSGTACGTGAGSERGRR